MAMTAADLREVRALYEPQVIRSVGQNALSVELSTRGASHRLLQLAQGLQEWLPGVAACEVVTDRVTYRYEGKRLSITIRSGPDDDPDRPSELVESLLSIVEADMDGEACNPSGIGPEPATNIVISLVDGDVPRGVVCEAVAGAFLPRYNWTCEAAKVIGGRAELTLQSFRGLDTLPTLPPQLLQGVNGLTSAALEGNELIITAEDGSDITAVMHAVCRLGDVYPPASLH